MHKTPFLLAALATLLLCAWPLSAQSDSWLDWMAELELLQSEAERQERSGAPLDAVRSRASAVADEMRTWTAAHPDVEASVPVLSGDDVSGWIGSLLEAARGIARSGGNSPFNLGRVEVNVSAAVPQTPTAVSVGQEEMRARNILTVPQALTLTPGVTLQRIGPRNETGVFVRGFDVRQVPFYIDGIPVYVPYDGYVDLDRFTTFDVAEVQVSKGFTSPLYGPNAIGGAINLVTKAPTEPLHLDLGAGWTSGRTWNGYANVGSRFERFWLQGGLNAMDSDYTPLSGDFQTNALQPTQERLNSYRHDVKGSFKVAWTPHGSDQYVFSYLNQQGEKGNPPYAGADPNVRVRYWQWPQWDKEGFYFSANKGLGETSYLRARLYYDKFDNYLQSFDDGTYTTQTRPYAFNSPYNDDTYGSILELGTGALARQTVKGSFYFKDDTHREGNVGEPERSFRDQSFSWGGEDTIQLSRRSSAVVGFSADYLTVRQAQDFQDGRILAFPTSSVWAFNPQAAIFYGVSGAGRARLSFARKTRLPTIKDRYSYRLGQAIPNPDLDREVSNNFEVGYSHTLWRTTTVDAAGFWNEIEDSVQAVYIETNLFQLRNVGAARNRGAEFSVRSQLRPNLQVWMNYTYLDRKYKSAPTLTPVDTPRHQTYGAVTWRPLGRLSLLADLRYEAGRYGNNPAGALFLAPQFANVGFNGTVTLGRGLELQAGLTNLLDRNYFLVEGYPEPGRSGFANLRYRF